MANSGAPLSWLGRISSRLSGFQGVGSLGAVHVLVLACGLGANVVWTRFMSQETFGAFKVVLSFINVVSAFCLMGASQVATMSAARDADGNLLPLLRTKLLVNLAGAAVVLGGALYYTAVSPELTGVGRGLFAAAVLFVLYNTSDLWTSWLNGKSRFSELALGRITTSLLALASILLLSMAGVNDLAIIVFLHLTVLGLQNLYMLRRALQLRSNDNVDAEIIALGRHANYAMMVGSLLSFDMILVGHFHSSNVVAIYAVALIFPEQIKALFSIVGQVLAPRMYQAKSLDQMWSGLRGDFILLTLGFITLGVVGFFLLPVVTSLLFSSKYAEAANHGKWLWLAIASLGSTSYLGGALTARHKVVAIYASSIAYPMLLLGLYFAWIGDGVSGMVTARVQATVALAAFYVAAFAYYLTQERRQNSERP